MKRQQDYYVILFLLFIMLFHIINNFVWLTVDNYFPSSDDAEHLWRSIDYYELVSLPSLKKLQKFFKMHGYYPPLFYYISVVLYLLLGVSYKVSVMTNCVFLIVLVFSTYKIAEKLGNKSTGLLSVFIVTTYPIIFGLSRVYMVDFALCAMVALSISILLHTDNFRNRNMSHLFGISLGLGMLVKPTFIIFLLFPFAFMLNDTYNLIKIKVDKKTALKGMIKDILYPLTSGFLIMCIWYIPNINNLIGGFKLLIFKEGPELNPYSIFSLRSFTFYISEMINSQITFVFFLAFLAGVVYLIRQKMKYKYFLLLSVFIPYFIFTMISLKDIRFTAPMLPIIAVISSLAIQNIQKIWLRFSLISLTIIYGIISLFSISYCSPKEVKVNTFMGEIKLLSNTPSEFCGCHFKPVKISKDFSILRDVFEFIKQRGGYLEDRKMRIGLISNNKLPLSLESMLLFAKMEKYPIDIISFCVSPHDFINQIDNLDILITSERLDDTYEEFRNGLQMSGVIKKDGIGDIVDIWNGHHRSNKEKINLKDVFESLKGYVLIERLDYGKASIYIHALNRD